MKSLKFVVLFVFAAALVSCSSDDDNSANHLNQENLIGIYKLESFNREETRKIDDGFDTEYVKTQEGENTSGLSYDFQEESVLLKDGNFRISQKEVKDGNEDKAKDTTYIEDFRDIKLDYVLDEEKNEITIDGKVYEVSSFDDSSFKLEFTDTKESGDETTEITENIELVR